MKLALLSDIHGNLPALEKVLDDISRQRITTIWFLGDWVGHGPFPNQVVQKLRVAGAQGIRGNYDRKVLEFEQKKKKLRNKMAAGKFAALKWTARELNKKSRAYLAALPAKLRIAAAGMRFLLVHGSPADDSEELTAATPLTRLLALAKQAGKTDAVLCGHSHQAFVQTAGNVKFINPGSAGRPFDGDNRVSYAVLDVAQGRVKVMFRRLAYEVARVVKAMQVAGLPDDQVRSFACGRSVDDLQQDSKDDKLSATAAHLGRMHRYEEKHAVQVTRLALQLFDALVGLHGLDADERHLLHTAGILHDIGIGQGADQHHKKSRDLIMAADLLLHEKHKKMVALIARYHRGALPDNRHRYYAELDKKEKKTVARLSAILRLADGLDRSHRDVVKNIVCRDGKEQVTLRLTVQGMALPERLYGRKKADLFEKVFGKKVVIR
jgi:putative phosphoesterase